MVETCVCRCRLRIKAHDNRLRTASLLSKSRIPATKTLSCICYRLIYTRGRSFRCLSARLFNVYLEDDRNARDRKRFGWVLGNGRALFNIFGHSAHLS